MQSELNDILARLDHTGKWASPGNPRPIMESTNGCAILERVGSRLTEVFANDDDRVDDIADAATIVNRCWSAVYRELQGRSA